MSPAALSCQYLYPILRLVHMLSWGAGMGWLRWKGRPLTLRRVVGYLRRKMAQGALVFAPPAPEQPWDWQRLAEALGALEEELQEVHSLLQDMSAASSPTRPPSHRSSA